MMGLIILGPHIIAISILIIIGSISGLIMAFTVNPDNRLKIGIKLFCFSTAIALISQVSGLIFISNMLKSYGEFWDTFYNFLPLSLFYYLPVLSTVLVFLLTYFIKSLAYRLYSSLKATNHF